VIEEDQAGIEQEEIAHVGGDRAAGHADAGGCRRRTVIFARPRPDGVPAPRLLIQVSDTARYPT
jgi:hypothetical protein